MKYEKIFKSYLTLVEKKLKGILAGDALRTSRLSEAMRYTVFTGGKRFRPVLTMAVCEACGGDLKEVLIPAVAIELIHTYSLVHDDLPALDNDDTRRGKPTCHKKFGEDIAILTGDALLTLAFELIAQIQPPEKAVGILREVSKASGAEGMIGGQIADLEAQEKSPDLAALDFISCNKTGQLIKASALVGALAAGASDNMLKSMTRYGEFIGLAFQVVDDILDRDGYLKVISKAEASEKAYVLIDCAKHEAQEIGKKAKNLVLLADFLLERIP